MHHNEALPPAFDFTYIAVWHLPKGPEQCCSQVRICGVSLLPSIPKAFNKCSELNM